MAIKFFIENILATISQDIPYLLIGVGVGIFCSILGALIDYFIARRSQISKDRRLPGCLLLIAGSLGFIGYLATFSSYIIVGSLRPAVLIGIGILAGFNVAFAILALAWLAAD